MAPREAAGRYARPPGLSSVAGTGAITPPPCAPAARSCLRRRRPGLESQTTRLKVAGIS